MKGVKKVDRYEVVRGLVLPDWEKVEEVFRCEFSRLSYIEDLQRVKVTVEKKGSWHFPEYGYTTVEIDKLGEEFYRLAVCGTVEAQARREKAIAGRIGLWRALLQVSFWVYLDRPGNLESVQGVLNAIYTGLGISSFRVTDKKFDEREESINGVVVSIYDKRHDNGRFLIEVWSGKIVDHRRLWVWRKSEIDLAFELAGKIEKAIS